MLIVLVISEIFLLFLENFEKFLVGRDGAVIGRFAPDMTPEDPAIVSAIEAALG